MVNEETEQLLRWDKEHILHPLFPVGENAGVVYKEGKGVFLHDTEGKEYIDLGSQLVCANLGYGRQEIIDRACEQLRKLQYYASFYGYSNTSVIECGRKLAEVVPEGLGHFAFTCGGSESTDTAFRLARYYWYNKGKSKYKIISLRNSYHGSTFGSISATGMSALSKGISPIVPGFVHIPGYYCYRCPFGLEYPNCDMRCARFLSETIKDEDPDTVAAFVAEPVQGVGGSIAPPPEYWPMVRKICTEYDVLLIADEVMSGFCRTGKFFALENWDVKPDIMTMAKGITSSYLPFGGVAVNNKIYEDLKGKPFMSMFTFGGHPVCAAAAVETINVYLREKVAENVVKVGRHVLERLHSEFEPLPCVGTIHGLGLFLSIELVADKKTRAMPKLDAEEFRRKGRENGIIARVAGGNKIQVCPPLIITMEEADQGLDRLLSVITSMSDKICIS